LECGCGIPPPPPLARTEDEGEGPLQPPASLALQSAPSCQQGYAAIIIIRSFLYQQWLITNSNHFVSEALPHHNEIKIQYNARHPLYPRQDVVPYATTYLFPLTKKIPALTLKGEYPVALDVFSPFLPILGIKLMIFKDPLRFCKY
jgi:hypothetical protein